MIRLPLHAFVFLVACAVAGWLRSAHAAEGLDGANITIGQSVALTGPAAQLGKPFALGAKLYFDRLNARGGVHGRMVVLQTLDDGGEPEATVANTKKLLAAGAFALFGYYGSPQLTAAYPAIKDSNMVLFAPLAAADEFRGAMYPNVYSLRPGYSEEAAALTRHALTLGTRNLAVLHAQDGESLAALDSAERTMSALGANLLIKAPLDAAQKVLGSKAESVLVIGEPLGAAGAIKDLRGRGFRGPIYAFSIAGESLLAELLGPAGSGVIVSRVVPRSDNGKMEITRDLMADLAAAQAGKPNVYILEGYLAARVLAEALRNAGKDLNRIKLRKAIEALDEVSIGDFRVHFAQERVASRLVQLGVIDSNGRVRD